MKRKVKKNSESVQAKVNMTFQEVMKKALNTPLPKKSKKKKG